MQQDPEQIARQREQLTRQLGRIVITCLEDGTTEDLVLNPDSTFFGASFVLDDVAGQDFGATLVSDGTQWFCVFTNVVSATDTNVIGRFVSNAGERNLFSARSLF